MFSTSEILGRRSTFFGAEISWIVWVDMRSYDWLMNEWTLFIAHDVGSGRPVSRAWGSFIKRLTKGKNKKWQ